MLSIATNLIIAVAMVESAGNIRAINRRHGAYGPLQIRQMCLDDVNRDAGTSYTLRQFVGNVPLSKWAFEVYGHMHGALTEEDHVRIWRGGARGSSRPKYDDYVKRVMTLYADLNKRESLK